MKKRIFVTSAFVLLILTAIIYIKQQPQSDTSGFKTVNIKDDLTIDVKRFSPPITIDPSLSGKNDKTELGLYQLQLHYIKEKKYDQYIKLHLDNDSAKRIAKDLQSPDGKVWLKQILDRTHGSNILALLKSDRYSVLITQKKGSTLPKYGIHAFGLDDKNQLKIIAVPGHYAKQMSDLKKAFDLLRSGDWKL